MGDHIQELEAETEAAKPYNAGDPKEVNNARKRAARKTTERLRVVEALMKHEDGRAWVYELLESCHLYTNPFTLGHPDATNFKLGEMNIGQRLLADIVAAAPKEYLKMCEEAKERK